MLVGHLFSVSYMHVFCICPCSAQLSMFEMEMCSRNLLIIIIIVYMGLSGTSGVCRVLYTEWQDIHQHDMYGNRTSIYFCIIYVYICVY